MSQFETAKSVRRFIVNGAAEVATYSWDDEFARKFLREQFAKAHDALKDVDPRQFTREQLVELGFGSWDGKLALIPLYWLPALPDGMELTAIDGEVVVVGRDEIDNDVRFGCTAYGFVPKESEVSA